MSKNKIFIKITNEEVYKELCEFKLNNEIQHKEIMKELERNRRMIMSEMSKQKSQVLVNRASIAGIGALCLFTLSWLISHIML